MMSSPSMLLAVFFTRAFSSPNLQLTLMPYDDCWNLLRLKLRKVEVTVSFSLVCHLWKMLLVLMDTFKRLFFKKERFSPKA